MAEAFLSPEVALAEPALSFFTIQMVHGEGFEPPTICV